ncbi:MAG: MoaD/ThiS family protein [Nocardioidaceae bacterium]|nr:MoaD/ThiS family protein [Nocardioidaceae bacterium]
MTVRYWAAARAAAGRESDTVAAGTLAEVLASAHVLHGDERFARVVAMCSVLVGEQPASTSDPTLVVVAPGQTVELLPPFAGGA